MVESSNWKGGASGGGADQFIMLIRWWRKLCDVVDWGFGTDLVEERGGRGGLPVICWERLMEVWRVWR